MQVTWVLPIVGLDIEAISSGNSVVLQSRLDEYSSALVLNIYLYQKARQRFRRTDFKFPTIGNTCSLAAIKMDTLTLQKYYRQSSLVDKKTNSLDRLGKRKRGFQGNTTLTNKGLIKSEQLFLEFFINDKPLSELLDNFYNSKATILDNWIGVLGSNPKTDIIKVKQLLKKEVSDKEIRQVYPSTWSDDEFSWYLDKYREELENPDVLIYCCAECGDYDCGGIAVTIDKTDTSVIWTIKGGDKALKFEFDKYSYFEVFNNYLRKLPT